MGCLILTGDASAAGNIQRAKLADETIGLAHSRVIGPLQTDQETVAFFGRQSDRTRIFWQSARGPSAITAGSGHLMGIVEFCADFQTVELWFDPTTEGQLKLAQLLSVLSIYPKILERVIIADCERPSANRSPEDLATQLPVRRPLEENQLKAAKSIWNAWQQSTPEAFFRLKDEDIGVFGRLSRAASLLRAELPSEDTALGATEMRLLELVGRPKSTWASVFEAYISEGGTEAASTTEAEQLLEGLARCPVPAVHGLHPDPLTEPEKFDHDSFMAHRCSELSLSALGHSIVARRDDFSVYNPIRRWWGNTELLNSCLWRCDHISGSLIRSK